MIMAASYVVGGVLYFLASTAFCVRIHRPKDAMTEAPWSDTRVVINCGMQSLFWPIVLPFTALLGTLWLSIFLGKKWVAAITPPEPATSIGWTPGKDTYLSNAELEVEAILVTDRYANLEPHNEIKIDPLPS